MHFEPNGDGRELKRYPQTRTSPDRPVRKRQEPGRRGTHSAALRPRRPRLCPGRTCGKPVRDETLSKGTISGILPPAAGQCRERGNGIMERKLVAIMACDIVGYSRLVSHRESDTIEGVQACFEYIRECVGDHAGRAFNSAGDSLLAEFGSVVDAVNCTLGICEFLEEINAGTAAEHQLQMRFGVHLGDVMVNDGDLLGDGVNIAARLEALAPPGGICVSETVHNNVVGRVDVAFRDLGERELKNIARPVHVYCVCNEDKPGAQMPDTAKPERPPASDVPAVAVLPFDNLGGGPGDDFFTDGLTEDIITALAAWRTFPVIARNSTFAYKGQSPDVRKVAEDLNARYVLEGSVRKAGSRVRINAQLIDAETGHHIWAEKFDRDIDDLFELQDEITHYLAAIVEPEINKTEQRRITPDRPNSLAAWELYQRGMAFLDRWTQEDNERARGMFRQAIDLDDRYAQAFTGLAYTHHRDIWFGYATDRDASIAAQLDAASKATSLDDGDSQAHCMLGFGHLWSRDYDRAIAEGERAIALNPSNFVALSQLGLALNYAGDPLKSIAILERAIVINPRNPRLHFVLSSLARSHLNARHPEEAAAEARRALTHHAGYPLALTILASALGHLGEADDAAKALERCEQSQPGFAADWARTRMYKKLDDDVYFLEGLKAAGLDTRITLDETR